MWGALGVGCLACVLIYFRNVITEDTHTQKKHGGDSVQRECARPEALSPPGSDDEDPLCTEGHQVSAVTTPGGGPQSTTFRGTQQPGEESLPLPPIPGGTQPADGYQPLRDGPDDGWCLACGQMGAAGGACRVCGGPVEPADQTLHYQYGWMPGPRAPGQEGTRDGLYRGPECSRKYAT